jgi:UDP-glucose 4-epimerase
MMEWKQLVTIHDGFLEHDEKTLRINVKLLQEDLCKTAAIFAVLRTTEDDTVGHADSIKVVGSSTAV